MTYVHDEFDKVTSKQGNHLAMGWFSTPICLYLPFSMYSSQPSHFVHYLDICDEAQVAKDLLGLRGVYSWCWAWH